MAIQKMKIVNIVGQMTDFHSVMQKIIINNDMQLIDAFRQINESKFTLEMASENLDEIVEMSTISTYKSGYDFSELERKLSKLIKNMEIDATFEESYFNERYDFDSIKDKIVEMYEDFENDHKRIDELKSKLAELNKMLCIEALVNINIDLEELYNMKNFSVKFGRLTQENRKRLSMNYENVTAAVMHLDVPEFKDYYVVISPKSLETETDRILRSVYFETIELSNDYLDYPSEMLEKIKSEIQTTNQELQKIYDRISAMEKNYVHEIRECYSKLLMEKKIVELSEKIPMTEHFFYCSAWIPESLIEKNTQMINNEERNLIIEVDHAKANNIEVPTKLKNNWITKPFETLVYMYGIPNYDEVDPTAFFSVVYMMLFGAMFGDLGQGFVFFLAGFFIKEKKKTFGEILTRVGLASMIFGFFYDSFFGYEHLISKVVPLNIYIRPIENINTMLTVAVALGIVLLYISFGYSIYNKLKISDLEEGVLGRNGVVGLILYTSILLIIENKFIGLVNINISILITLVVLSIILMLFKEPIINKINKEDSLYTESAGEYYVESGFELIETFLSMLSNTLSFIRVGAFALNHVGLFIAFHTMADLIGSTFGNISMFILGNALIIFLEGLVVFIQGLRLMYYEIFSKYYIGNGKGFKPSGLE